jgi:hypothetical protein
MALGSGSREQRRLVSFAQPEASPAQHLSSAQGVRAADDVWIVSDAFGKAPCFSRFALEIGHANARMRQARP